ncbi:MAG: tryptophan--tRNA ligase [Candidatus Peribacteraceae bacterium]|nr:tryptophan--tRNA ligase [Candidatus Peribacteraceae bacterium]
MSPSSPPLSSKIRVLDGIQPSGIAHLGNYFGYIRPNVQLLGKGEIFLMVADLHALTTVRDPAILSQARRDVATDLLACGYDPDRGTLFYQSDVAVHSELSWILSTITPMGLLERAVSYKDKVEKGIAASVGLFTYPVLMAADILLYDATLVPVGRDQKQHVEIARDIAVKFNSMYGETFVLPEALIGEDTAAVLGTDGQKMSKSYGNIIPIFGEEKAIKKAIMGIVTDSKDVAAPKDPETCTVFRIHKLFLSKEESNALADRYRAGGLGYGDAKKLLFETYLDHFGGMRKKRGELVKNAGFVEEVMRAGAVKAKKIAEATMERVRGRVGL